MANIKICSKCGKIGLDQYDFYVYWNVPNNKYYYRSFCTECEIQKILQRYKNNPEYFKQWQKNNKDKVNIKNELWRKNNSKKMKKCRKQWKTNNKNKVNSCTAKRRAMKLNQTPVDANQDEILYIYELCSLMNEYGFGIKYEVDHIKPIARFGKRINISSI